jgi:hypothetical protein
MNNTLRPEATTRTACRSRACRSIALLFAVLLSACGGGGDGAAAGAVGSDSLHAQGPAASVLTMRPAGQPGLVAQPIQAADVEGQGSVRQVTVGRQDGGGYAVAWNVVQGASWALWAQSYGADGTAQDSPQPLLNSARVPGVPAEDVATAVLPNGTVALAYVASRDEQAPSVQKVYEVRTRRLALHGTPQETERVIFSSVTTGTPPFYRGVLQGIGLQKWDDGRLLVDWQVVAMVPQGGDHPVYQMVRLDANGRPDSAVHSDGPVYTPPLRLMTLPDGSWLASSPFPRGGSDVAHLNAGFVQFEARHPLQLPDRDTLPFGSFVLPLRRAGSVLFSGDFGPGLFEVVSPYSQRYNPSGRPAGPRMSLPMLPAAAVALDDGTYVALTGDWAQRFDRQGREVGAPFSADGSAQDALDGGGMVVAAGTNDRVTTQVFLDPHR